MSRDKEKLHDRVLFESNRTCCICRDSSRPVQIHHIDRNHSNDTRSNLAVTCDICHKLAHTDIPFSRNLTPEQVRMYDESWRAVCAIQFSPNSTAREIEEYRQEVILEISLACHSWKNAYMALYPGNFRSITGNYKDVWDLLIEYGVHENTEEEWKNYFSLFNESIDTFIDSARSLLSSHSNVLPVPLKTLTIRTIRQLLCERTVYRYLDPQNVSIKMRIQGVLQALASLARSAGQQSKISPVVHFKE